MQLNDQTTQPARRGPAPSARVLVADGQAARREAIAAALRGLGHLVITSPSGEDAIEHVGRAPPDVVLCDVALLDAGSPDLLTRAPAAAPGRHAGIVVLSDPDRTAVAAACLERGAVDYLTGPLTVEDLQDAVHRAQMVAGFGASATVGMLDALVAALEAKSAYLAGHSARVAAWAASVARRLSLADDVVSHVRIAGRLHDLGMIGVKDQVIDKHGELTADEHAHVRAHVAIGVRLLAPLRDVGRTAVDFVRTHHERWDGQGYPAGLTEDEIPLGGRIIAVCEIFDALTTRRPYRDRVPPAIALDRLQALAGTAVDPVMVEALARAVQHRQALIVEE